MPNLLRLRVVSLWMPSALTVAGALSCDRTADAQTAVSAPPPVVEVSDSPASEAPAGAPVKLTCPPGMLLVPGGQPTAEQAKRWSEWAGHPVGAIESFCLDELLVSRAEYARCPRGSSGCLPRNVDKLGADELRLPETQSFSRAHPYCEFFDKRIPSLEEMMWAIAGGREDRSYPWGEAPLDQTRAPAFDEADKQRSIADAHKGCVDEGYKSEFCDNIEEIVETRKGAVFAWDDGARPGEHPVDAMPDGAGRWGHLGLARPTWVLFGSDEHAPQQNDVGRCGFFARPGDDGNAPNFHGSTCPQFWTCPPCRKGNHSDLAIRCAAEPVRLPSDR